MPNLFKPYSRVHRRNFPRPVFFDAAALEALQPVDNFRLGITLWGRQAVSSMPVVIETVREMGRRGLNDSSRSAIEFDVVEIAEEPIVSIGARAAALGAVDLERIRMEFCTPYLYSERYQTEQGTSERLFLAGGALPLDRMLGNAAYELVAWDLEDRQADSEFDREARHILARQARRAAESAAENIVVASLDLVPVRTGLRRSKSNGRTFPIEGFVGEAELRGDLHAILPWLLTLNLTGGGQRRSMGFGAVRLYV